MRFHWQALQIAAYHSCCLPRPCLRQAYVQYRGGATVLLTPMYRYQHLRRHRQPAALLKVFLQFFPSSHSAINIRVLRQTCSKRCRLMPRNSGCAQCQKLQCEFGAPPNIGGLADQQVVMYD